jgi:hypothetical protein
LAVGHEYLDERRSIPDGVSDPKFAKNRDTSAIQAKFGCLGIEVEHVFHAGDIFAVNLWDAPHVPAPRLEAVLGQASPEA